MSYLVLALQKLLVLMGSKPYFIRNIGVLSKMWFSQVSGIFFGKKLFLKEQNHLFIALIPKQLVDSSVHQFRPISLYNIIYKIISKILANRFKGLLHHFISPYQYDFVTSKNIQGNTILAHEIINSINSKNGR
jgi:hypothetical protein